MSNLAKIITLFVLVIFGLGPGCVTGNPDPLSEAGAEKAGAGSSLAPNGDSIWARFIEEHTALVEDRARALNRAWWTAVSSLSPESAQGAAGLEKEIIQIYRNRKHYDLMQGLVDGPRLSDPLARRQLELVFQFFKESLADRDQAAAAFQLQEKLQRDFADFRPGLDGRELSSLELSSLVAKESDEQLRKKIWQARMVLGASSKGELLALVRLRNKQARARGYKDFYHQQLRQSELDPGWLQNLVARLERETEPAWRKLRQRIFSHLAERFAVRADGIQPWHLDDPFFMQVPVRLLLDLDPVFGQPLLPMVSSYLKQVELDPGAILERSLVSEELDPQRGPVCLAVDRVGDVRLLVSLTRSAHSARVLLHTMGHCLYLSHIDQNLPWLLRIVAHDFIAEGVARLLAQQVYDPDWLKSQLKLNPARWSAQSGRIVEDQRARILVFVRYSLLLIHFERELYADPEQDLDSLWAELRTRYQDIGRNMDSPSQDWAAQVQLVSHPVNQHNYLLGQILAEQLKQQLGPAVKKDPKALGQFLKKGLFDPGASKRWDELLAEVLQHKFDPKFLISHLFHSSP